MPTCTHCSLTILALILLYGGHYVLPSKVTHGFTHHVRLLASCNNAPQHDGAGFKASSNVVYWLLKGGCDPFNAQNEYKSSLATFSQEFLTIDKLTLEKTALYISCDLATMHFNIIASLRIGN